MIPCCDDSMDHEMCNMGLVSIVSMRLRRGSSQSTSARAVDEDEDRCDGKQTEDMDQEEDDVNTKNGNQ